MLIQETIQNHAKKQLIETNKQNIVVNEDATPTKKMAHHFPKQPSTIVEATEKNDNRQMY